MPKGKTKKFIDKNDAESYVLVHRSQRDPLAADETAPQRVLVPVNSSQQSKTEKNSSDPQKRKEEQQKYGIYFDDDYDYLKHLRDVKTLPVEWSHVERPNNNKDDKNDKNDTPKIILPSSVFASTVEEDIGLLNRAAPISGPRLDLDPEIVAAMDDDFDYQNDLEDNFMELANAGGSDVEFNEEDEENYETDNSVLSDEERDEVCSLNGPQFTFEDEETRSRFTEYSMSSSVIRRNEQLTLLDDKFERMFAAYDENEIGALDCEEIEGYVAPDSEIMLQYAAEFEKQRREDADNVVKLMQDRLKIIEHNETDSEEEMDKIEMNRTETDQWDCESIISTYSNIYHHPKLISEPKKHGKIRINASTGIPKDVLNGKPGKLTTKSLAQLDMQNQSMQNKANCPQSIADTMKSVLSVLSVRSKDETPEERKERKAALKNYRKERRIERKVNTLAFKDEKKRQEKQLLNDKYNKGNRIL